MFKNVRVGSSLYLLHKNEPKLEIGEVVFVDKLPPKFNMTYQNGVPYQQQENLLNIRIRVGEEDVSLQQVNADVQSCDMNGMVVTCDRDTMLTEVCNLQKISNVVLGSIDKHREIVAKCDEFKEMLSPEIRKEAERAQEMEALKGDVVEIKRMLSDILKTSKKE